MITTFKRKDNSELMDPIVIYVDEEARYVKLSLYYRDNLLEDYYLRVPKQVGWAIFETVGISDTVAVTKVQYKEKIKARYIEARNEKNDTDTKGKALEEVIAKILELVPDLEIVETRVTNGIQEIDIMVRNYNKSKVWADFESVFFVECKNWFKGDIPDAATIGDFKRKLENKNLRTGIFVAPNGITEGTGNDKVYGAMGQLYLYFKDGIKIVVLEDEDIQAILNCRGVTEQINERFLDLCKS